MRQGDLGIEGAVEFSRCRVEIRNYEWGFEWNGMRRTRPDMYIFELNLSQNNALPPTLEFDHPSPGSFQAGDVACILPHSKVERHMASGWRRALLCMFDREWVDDLLPRMIREGVSHLSEASNLGRLEWLLRNIYQEMRREPDFGSAIVVESFAKALAVELTRRLVSRTNDSGLQKGGLALRRMPLLQERIYSNIVAPSLSELAALCGMTVRHLCRAFKAETGLTPGQYIQIARTQHARTLLSETLLSLAEIAHHLGFATSASFSNAFQRATGLRPRQIERSATPTLSV